MRSARHSPLATLLETLCTALGESYTVLRRTTKRPHERARAQAIIDALEPQAIACLDEELAGVPVIQKYVCLSQSRALVEHLRTMVTSKITLDPNEWTMLLIGATPEYVGYLLDVALRPQGAIVPFLSQRANSIAGWEHLFLDRLVSSYDLNHDELTELLSFRQERGIALVAETLKRQVRDFPAEMSAHARDLLADNQLYNALCMILAGLPAQQLKLPAGAGPFTRYFHAQITSTHGLLKALSVCTDLETTMGEDGCFGTYERQIYDAYRATNRPAESSQKVA